MEALLLGGQQKSSVIAHRSLQAASPTVWIARTDGVITFLSQQWSDLTGRDLPEQRGSSFLDCLHPKDKERVRSIWQASVQSQQPFRTELRLRCADGSYRRCMACAEPAVHPEFDSDIDLAPWQEAEWLGTFTDVEPIREIQSKFVSDQEFLQSLIENLSDGIVACDENGILTIFNTACQEFHGLPALPLPAEKWAEHYDLFHSDGQTLLKTEEIPLFRALNGEAVSGVKMMIRPRRGKARMVLASGSPIYDHDGRRLGAVVAMRDITAYEQVEADLCKSEHRFRAIFNHTLQFTNLLEPDGTVIEANQTALDFGGFSAERVIGKLYWETSWWTHCTAAQEQVRQATVRAAQGRVVCFETTLLGAGATMPIDFSIKPVWDEVGNVILLIAEGRDITERKQASAEIDRLNATLEQRVAERTAQLEESNRHNELLLVRERAAKAEAESAIAELEVTNCRNEDLLQREHQARAEAEEATAAVRSYAERLGLATDAAKLGLWDLDCRTNLSIWNAQCQILLGYEPTQPERSHTDWERRLHPEDRERVKREKDRAAAEQTDFKIQYRILLPGGSLRWISAFGRFYYDAQGQSCRMIGILSDITDRKQAEEALAESEEQFRATFEQAAIGIGHVGVDGRWLRVNPKLCQITGYSPEELAQLTFQQITHPEDLNENLRLLKQLLGGETETYSLEKRYIRKDGSTVWIELTVALMRHSVQAVGETLGAPKYFISIIEDISERKQAREALQERAQELASLNVLITQAAALLEHRNQELDQFVHIVSHDLKAPLRAISNLSEWIESDLEGQLPPNSQQQLELLRVRAKRMESMINSLLVYARAGRQNAALETFDVAELLSEVIDSVDPPRSFSVQVKLPMPVLTTRRTLLNQVFSNLISNAVKHHTAPDGHLNIACSDRKNFYEFSVQDDGPGIASKNHKRVFEIFQTLSAQNSSESSGVGLAIVRKIVEAEEGSIWIESEVGGGATFFFTWPKIDSTSSPTTFEKVGKVSE